MLFMMGERGSLSRMVMKTAWQQLFPIPRPRTRPSWSPRPGLSIERSLRS